MEARFFLTAAVLAGVVSVFVAFYLRWAVKKLVGYRPDYFVCYWLALVGCLTNLFLPFVYQILMVPYRKLPPWAELTFLNLVGFLISLLLYLLWIRGSEGRLLSWPQAALITGGQYVVFMIFSHWAHWA
jgi:hypothetical protein